jgi:hypothetical protein
MACIDPGINPIILRDLHRMQERATPGIVTCLMEGHISRVSCEVADCDAVHVTLFDFAAGALIPVWLDRVQEVEVVS